MKTVAVILLCAPLCAWSQCTEADRNAFFSMHAAGANSCKPAADNICLENPGRVDDALFSTVVDPHPMLFPKVQEAQVRRWPHARKDANNVAARTPPATFLIVDDAPRLDMTWRSVFVTCDGAHVYLRDRGGIGGQWDWYGPIPISVLIDLKTRRYQ